MASYEYEVTVKEDGGRNPNKKELVVECDGSSVRIMSGNNPDGGAIVAFRHDGTIKIYRNTAERAGFKPETS